MGPLGDWDNLMGARGSSSAWRMLSSPSSRLPWIAAALLMPQGCLYPHLFLQLYLHDRSFAPAPRSRWIVRGGATRSAGLSLTTCQVWATPFFCLRLTPLEERGSLRAARQCGGFADCLSSKYLFCASSTTLSVEAPSCCDFASSASPLALATAS